MSGGFYYLPVSQIITIVTAVVQSPWLRVLEHDLAIEIVLALSDDNKAKNHWYPKTKFLIYRVVYYKKRTTLGLKDRVIGYR